LRGDWLLEAYPPAGIVDAKQDREKKSDKTESGRDPEGPRNPGGGRCFARHVAIVKASGLNRKARNAVWSGGQGFRPEGPANRVLSTPVIRVVN